MADRRSLDSLEVTNQCVVVCDLGEWAGAESSAWEILRGSQEEVGRRLAALLDARGIRRLHDFGGVCKTFLCDGDRYRETPPRIRGNAGVFSFTPKKRLLAEGLEMARVASAAGYRLLVMTVQKSGKFGKVWVLQGALGYLSGGPLIYYEDTDSVVDELKQVVEADRITAVHVQVPGYEEFVSSLADRVINQSEYREEVLA